MAEPRLTLAFDNDLLPLPKEGGKVLWFGLGAAHDIPSDIATQNLMVIQPHQPLCASLKDAGLQAEPDLPKDMVADYAIITLPRARARAQLWIAQALACLSEDGVLVVDGAKTDGVDSLFKVCRGELHQTDSYTKSHGRVFWGGKGSADLSAWLEFAPTVDGFVTGPGVFSADGVDPASALLVSALPSTLSGRVADLGAGWGYLAHHVLAHDGVTSLDLVEADHMAISSAQKNISDPRAAFHWGDATVWKPQSPWDVVVMNPPFHTARAAEPALGRAFIEAAARAMTPKGKLWMVANRHLPYEAELQARFRVVEELKGSGAFKLFRAEAPKKSPKGA